MSDIFISKMLNIFEIQRFMKVGWAINIQPLSDEERWQENNSISSTIISLYRWLMIATTKIAFLSPVYNTWTSDHVIVKYHIGVPFTFYALDPVCWNCLSWDCLNFMPISIVGQKSHKLLSVCIHCILDHLGKKCILGQGRKSEADCGGDRHIFPDRRQPQR